LPALVEAPLVLEAELLDDPARRSVVSQHADVDVAHAGNVPGIGDHAGQGRRIEAAAAESRIGVEAIEDRGARRQRPILVDLVQERALLALDQPAEVGQHAVLDVGVAVLALLQPLRRGLEERVDARLPAFDRRVAGEVFDPVPRDAKPFRLRHRLAARKAVQPELERAPRRALDAANGLQRNVRRPDVADRVACGAQRALDRVGRETAPLGGIDQPALLAVAPGRGVREEDRQHARFVEVRREPVLVLAARREIERLDPLLLEEQRQLVEEELARRVPRVPRRLRRHPHENGVPAAQADVRGDQLVVDAHRRDVQEVGLALQRQVEGPLQRVLAERQRVVRRALAQLV